jgi:hypothetical protein
MAESITDIVETEPVASDTEDTQSATGLQPHRKFWTEAEIAIIAEMFVIQKMTISQIGIAVGRSKMSIASRLRRSGVSAAERDSPNPELLTAKIRQERRQYVLDLDQGRVEKQSTRGRPKGQRNSDEVLIYRQAKQTVDVEAVQSSKHHGDRIVKISLPAVTELEIHKEISVPMTFDYQADDAAELEGIPFIQGGEGICRWPLWVNHHDPRRICGAKTTRGVYCDHHTSISYNRTFFR